jgi:hypothetical protein
VTFILGWTPKGRATALATALFGPWPNSWIRRLGSLPSPCLRGLNPALACAIISSTTSVKGVVFAIKYPPWAWSNIRTNLPLCCAWVWGGPGCCLLPSDYGFAPVAATPVRDPWPDGDANSCNFRRRRSLFPPVPSYGAGFLPLFILLYSLQYTFMLSLEVVDPGDSLTTSLICHVHLA